MKDNLSLINKRLRCNEYISSFITAEVSKRINRIVHLGDKAGLSDMLKAFKFPEDIFLSRLYTSGVLRYIENDSDIDMSAKFSYTAKGPNALGNRDSRRIPIRQRTLHPSFLGWIDVAATSSSDPGRSGALSPYNPMKSLYFDDSLYENEMHYKIAKFLESDELDNDCEELCIKCDNEGQYNAVLDALYNIGSGKIKMYGVTNMPFEIIVEKDVRDKYRKFDESNLATDPFV